MNQIICGYRYWGNGNRCPYCDCDYMAVEDDGQPDSYLVRCWCGAHARVRKDDADLVQAVTPTQVRHPGGGS